MDKVLKEKIINNTFEGIDKIIESQYKDHPNESSYSICRIQEGYNDYLKINFRKGKINFYTSDFDWDTTPDLKITCEELKEVKRDDFVEEIVSPFFLLSYISILSSLVNLLMKKLHLQSCVQDFGCSSVLHLTILFIR